MSSGTKSKRAQGIAAAAAAVVGVSALAVLPSSASAASGSCDATALQLSLLGGDAIVPTQANPAFSPCGEGQQSLTNDASVLGIVGANAVNSGTSVLPAVGATSTSQVAGLHVGVTGPLLTTLTGSLLTGPNSIVGNVNTALGGLLGPGSSLGGASGPLSGLLGNLPLIGGISLAGTNDAALLSGLTTGLPAGLAAALPNVADAQTIGSTAQATCNGATPTTSGSSDITGLNVLGTAINPNDAATRTLSLDTTNLNLGQTLSVDDILRGTKVQTTGALGVAIATVNGGSTTTNLYDLLHSTDAGVVGALNTVLGALTGQTLGQVLDGVTSTLQPQLNATTVALPAGILQATVKPSVQTVSGDMLTQQSVVLSVTALGAPAVSGVFAESRVTGSSAECRAATDPTGPGNNDPGGTDPRDPGSNGGGPGTTPGGTGTVPGGSGTTKVPSGGTASTGGSGSGSGKNGTTAGIKNPTKYASATAELALQCVKGSATLIDVYGSRGRTVILGAAQRQFVGKTATIYLAAGKKRVGTAKIQSSGAFSTRVALPPAKIRNTNKARYYAVVGGKRTTALKFARRLLTSSISARAGKVTIKGQVVAPRFRKQRTILIKQRVTCKTYKTVGRAKPNAKGVFKTSFKAPKNASAAVYRAQTVVPRTSRSTAGSATFTLPRVVGL